MNIWKLTQWIFKNISSSVKCSMYVCMLQCDMKLRMPLMNLTNNKRLKGGVL